MAVTSTTGVAGQVQTAATFATPEIKTFYDLQLLLRALPELVHCSFARPGNLPERAGGTIEWRKASSLSAATTALTEGVTPASTAGDWGYVNLTPAWYGAFIRHSDVFILTAIDNIIAEDSGRLGEQAGNTADQLCRDLMITGGTAQIVGQTVNTSITDSDNLTADELLKAWATLKANNARGWDFLDGRYAVVLHAYAWKDLMRDAEFRNAIQEAAVRSDDHPLFTGEIWDFMGMRFFITSNAKMTADGGSGAVDLYYTLVLARDAFGIGGIANMLPNMELGMGGTGESIRPVELIFTQPGGPGDELKQRSSIGWKFSQQEVELDANWCIRIEHSCSMGSNT
jgi:N4-gp56 family major capsid protein